MPVPFAAQHVQCPFYHKHDAGSITCEGVLDTTTSLKNNYKTPEERRRQLDEVCSDVLACRDCPIHIILMQKYEEAW